MKVPFTDDYGTWSGFQPLAVLAVILSAVGLLLALVSR